MYECLVAENLFSCFTPFHMFRQRIGSMIWSDDVACEDAYDQGFVEKQALLDDQSIALCIAWLREPHTPAESKTGEGNAGRAARFFLARSGVWALTRPDILHMWMMEWGASDDRSYRIGKRVFRNCQSTNHKCGPALQDPRVGQSTNPGALLECLESVRISSLALTQMEIQIPNTTLRFWLYY